MSKNDIVTDAVALAVSSAQNDVLITLIQNYFDLQKDGLATANALLGNLLQVADELVRSHLITKEENLKFENVTRSKDNKARRNIELLREEREARQSYREYTLKKAEILLEQNRVTQDILQSMYRLKEIDSSIKFPSETLDNLKVEPLFQKKNASNQSKPCQRASGGCSKKNFYTDEHSVWVNDYQPTSDSTSESNGKDSSTDESKKSNLKNVFKDIEKSITTFSKTTLDSSIKSPIRKNLKSQAGDKNVDVKDATNEEKSVIQPNNKPFAWEEVETEASSKPSEVSKIKKPTKGEPTSKIAKKSKTKEN
jgi:hypothetical protein